MNENYYALSTINIVNSFPTINMVNSFPANERSEVAILLITTNYLLYFLVNAFLRSMPQLPTCFMFLLPHFLCPYRLAYVCFSQGVLG